MEFLYNKKKIELRKHLNADALISFLRSRFEEIEDHRSKNTKISLPDARLFLFESDSL